MPVLRFFAIATATGAGLTMLVACSKTPSSASPDAGHDGSDAGALPPVDADPDAALATDASDAAASGDGSDAQATPEAGPFAEAGSADADAAADGEGGVGSDAGDGSEAGGADAGPLTTYTNPVLALDFPDPFVLRQGSTYFAFGTNADSKNVQAASSTDLARWTPLPDALPILPAWAVSGRGLTWAPAILARGAGFVMYYTTRDRTSGFQCVSRATAANPAGPYTDSSAGPFVCQVSGSDSLCGSIDPSPFVDSDGSAYLLWKSDENAPSCAQPPRLWSAPLSTDGLSLAGPATELLVMDQPWEQPIVEGPAMTFVDGTYYLLYSANNYESAAYAMGYATCLSPSGPCENVSVSGPAIASAGAALGPGGGSFFDDVLGDHWLAYHAWTAPRTTYAGGGARSLRVDRLVLRGGVLSLNGPTTTPQPL